MTKKKAPTNPKKSFQFQFPLRIRDANLIAAVDLYAKSVRRSRTMAVVLLLETALEKEGFWPRGNEK